MNRRDQARRLKRCQKLYFNSMEKCFHSFKTKFFLAASIAFNSFANASPAKQEISCCKSENDREENAVVETHRCQHHVVAQRCFQIDIFCRQLRPSSATRPSDEVIPLGYPLQNWHFLNLGRQIWNQDCDKILNFFEKSFLPKWRLDPKAQPFLLWDQYLIPKKFFLTTKKLFEFSSFSKI